MQEKLIDILSRATAWMTAQQIADAGGWRSASNVTVALSGSGLMRQLGAGRLM